MSDKDLKIDLGFAAYPRKFTCDGEGVSPPISISDLTAPYLAMVLDDPDATHGPFIHWTIWNIPATDRVPEKISPERHPPELPGSSQGLNSDQEVGYVPPCPPRGSHRYFLRVYGLDAPLELEAGASREQLEKAMKGRVVQYGEAMATYARPR